MNPQTSEILALANWPRVDANNPGGAPAYAQQNRAVGFHLRAGLDLQGVHGRRRARRRHRHAGQDLLPADRAARRRPDTHDDHARGEETATVAQILAESSNIGAVRVALDMGARRFSQWVDRFGFGRRTGIALPGEEIGLVPTYDDYSGSSIANLPIGQGEAVTPMQMMQAYAAIANGGVLRAPRVIEKVGGVSVPQARGRRILSQQSAAEVREMLKGVLSAGGTAAEAAIPGYDLAGKTGTANKVDADTGEYSRSRYIASFMGFAPVKDPKLLVSVVVDEPQGSIYGGQVAAPAFQKIAAWALPYFGVQPN